MSNELTVRNTFMVAPEGFDEEMAREMEEQMAGVAMQFPKLKVGAGGMAAFQDENGDPVKKVVGIIVDQHQVNAYWENSESPDGSVPDCMSNNGVNGYKADGTYCGACAACPMNQFGSGRGGRGKACNNKVRLYVLPDHETAPVQIDLPATSIKPFGNYMSYLRGQRMLMTSVVTEIALQKVQKGENTYAVATFKPVEKLAPEAAREAMQYARSMRQFTRSGAVETGEETPFAE